MPSLKNSVEAQSSAKTISSPTRWPAASQALAMKESASSADSRLGAKPPSSPTLVEWPASCSAFLRAWNTSAPMRAASAVVPAPTGMTMNSWMSIGLSAWAPPLMMFIIGTGSVRA